MAAMDTPTLVVEQAASKWTPALNLGAQPIGELAVGGRHLRGVHGHVAHENRIHVLGPRPASARAS
jgi:hypothetical protein